MTKGRLEAFSDGVMAIIITIMVLGLEPPRGTGIDALAPLVPALSSYVLSFVIIGIYWNNHHHLIHASKHVDGRVLWANLHLLFWLSLTPFVTAWMGQTGFSAWSVFAYGIVILMSAIAYFILVQALLAVHGADSVLARAIGSDFKGKVSIVITAVALGTSLFIPLVALALYVLVAVLWLVPDRRLEKSLPR